MSSPPAARRSSTRSRKAVSRFDPVSARRYALLNRDDNPSPGRNGDADPSQPSLGDIPAVGDNLRSARHGSTDEVVVLLHRALYGRDGKAHARKAGIRKWHGTKDEEERQRVTRSMNSSKWTTALLGELCLILCLDKSGTKAVVLDRVLSMLLDPTADHEDKKLPVVKKKKPKKKPRAKKKQKLKKKSAGRKRTPSSYMLWMNSVGRAEVKEQNPEAKVTEVATMAGQMWRGMSDEDKQQYVDEAAELKEQAAAAAPRQKKSRSTPTKSRKRKASTPAKPPAPKQSAKSRLRDAKQMLDEGLIEQEEYDDLKKKILASLAR